MRVLEVMTEHTAPFKMLFEVLKEILPEAHVEFINDKKKTKKTKLEDDTDVPDDAETETETDAAPANDKSGMKITAVDNTKSIYINMKLDARNFSPFKCKHKNITIMMDMSYFYKLIKPLDKDEQLLMYMDSNNMDYLNIQFKGNKAKHSVIKMKLMDNRKTATNLPNTKFDAVVTIKATDFHKDCKDFSVIGDYIEIQCQKTMFIIKAKSEKAEKETIYKTMDSLVKASAGEDEEGSDGGDTNTNLVTIEMASKDSDKVVQGIYEVKNLNMFNKFSQFCDYIEIYIKQDNPIIIKYDIASLGRILSCIVPVKPDVVDNFDEPSDDRKDEPDEDDEVDEVDYIKN